MSQFPNLLSSLQLGPVTLRNRVMMSALTRDRSVPTNVPNGLNLEYYKQRAAGGNGLIVTEGTLIVQQGTEWQHAPGIWSEEQVQAWKKITDAVHEYGSAIFCQLWHLGRVSHPDAPEQIAAGTPVYAPSAVPARGGKFRFLQGAGYVTPTAIDDPRKLIAQFKEAAINAKKAGFDGVELHGANGYLVHQFLDNTSNHRTDEWGGSVENRARFGLETLQALINVFGADRVAIKLSPAGGYNDMGMTLEDTVETFKYFIEKADAMGIVYFTLARYAEMMDPVIDGKKRATQHDILATYRPFIKNAKLILNAGLTPAEAEKLIAEGQIDAGCFGLLSISHPDLVNRIKEGKPYDTPVDFMHLYGGGATDLEQLKIGYTSYPFATEPKV